MQRVMVIGAPRQREKVKAWAQEKTVVNLKSRRDVRRFLATLSNKA